MIFLNTTQHTVSERYTACCSTAWSRPATEMALIQLQ